MALQINTLGSVLTAQTSLNRAHRQAQKSIQRLSTGLQINGAADGAAALAISEVQKAQISGLGVALNNTDRATSLVKTAEGAFTEINALLVSMRDRALDAANAGIHDESELAKIQAEIEDSLDALDAIVDQTQFGSRKLLDGSASKTVTIADGENQLDLRFKDSELSSGSTNNVTIGNFSPPSLTVDQGADFGITAPAAGGAICGIGPGQVTLHITQDAKGTYTIEVNGHENIIPTDVGGQGIWEQMASMPTARHTLSCAVVDGDIYAIGGHVWNSRNENERYDPETDTWDTLAPMPIGVSGPGVAAYGGKVYAFGGNHYGSYQSAIQVYDPVSDTWQVVGNMPQAGEPWRAVTLDGKIYLAGGRAGRNMGV